MLLRADPLPCRRLRRKARVSCRVPVVATSQMEDVSLDPQFAELFTILRTHEWALHVDRLSLSGEPADFPVSAHGCARQRLAVAAPAVPSWAGLTWLCCVVLTRFYQNCFAGVY